MARKLDRRTVLRGCGTAIAMPLLDAMAPLAEAAGPRTPANVPLRMAFLYTPNGMHMPAWTPSETGSAYKLPPTLQPLKKFRGDFSVLSGLAHRDVHVGDALLRSPRGLTAGCARLGALAWLLEHRVRCGVARAACVAAHRLDACGDEAVSLTRLDGVCRHADGLQA